MRNALLVAAMLLLTMPAVGQTQVPAVPVAEEQVEPAEPESASIPDQPSPPPAAEPSPEPPAPPAAAEVEAAVPEGAEEPAPDVGPMPTAADAAEAIAPAAEAPALATDAAPLASGSRRIVVLPVEFVVYEKSVAGIEAVPGWSEQAQLSLAEASARMLQFEDRFAVVPVPGLDEPGQSVLREHVELFKIIADTVTGVVFNGGKAWAAKKTSFDYTLGDGLAFLADSAGAEYAFVLAGKQLKQTGGSVLFQLLAAAGGVSVPGGGMFAAAGIIELRSGRVAWINSVQGGELFGMTSNDVRKPESADAVLKSMFAGYPASRLVTLRML
ncbi:MAG: hypothetical protein FJ191_01650 [Gammaproteobacteria bacterium]|nr:hypothetical protein [Gammaproteobacteria bacterium]